MDNVTNSCSFCAELGGEKANNLLRVVLGEEYNSRIVFETKNFVVLPTIGQIVEGYLLILPKRHYLSFGHIPVTNLDELTSLKEETRQTLQSIFGTPVFFEHGPVSENSRGGCCVDHAHIHAVPAHVCLLDELSTNFQGNQIDNMLSLAQQVQRRIPYLFYQGGDGQMFLFDAPSVPSQYLRKLLATQLGLKERWDWCVWHGVPELISTLRKLDFWHRKISASRG